MPSVPSGRGLGRTDEKDGVVGRGWSGSGDGVLGHWRTRRGPGPLFQIRRTASCGSGVGGVTGTRGRRAPVTVGRLLGCGTESFYKCYSYDSVDVLTGRRQVLVVTPSPRKTRDAVPTCPVLTTLLCLTSRSWSVRRGPGVEGASVSRVRFGTRYYFIRLYDVRGSSH